jgi:hypothetical protein
MDLDFLPYLVAIWSEPDSAFDHIHRWLTEQQTPGYLGYTHISGLANIEAFHIMARQLDLGFDAIVKAGRYLYPKGSDHPLSAESMSEMGFSPAEV